MADLFTISPSIRSLAQNAIDTMITQLGKDCLLTFDSGVVQCPNCRFDPVAKSSSGLYNGTGPRPFAKPPCPVCRGRGLVDGQGVTRVARFLIDWRPKYWQFIDTTGIKVPQGVVQTKGFISDMPDVIQAKHIIIDYQHAEFVKAKFYLWGEPIPQGNIVPNRYFIAFWSRSPD